MNKTFYENKNIVIEKDRAFEQVGVDDDGRPVINMKIFNTSLSAFESDVEKLRVEMPYKNPYEKKANMRASLEKNEIPYIVYVVYHYFVTYRKFPTLDQLVAEYLTLYCEKVNKGLYRFKEEFDVWGDPTVKTNDIRGRIYRAYFSYIREIHLLYSLFQYDDIDVKYDMKVDLVDGLDLIVTCNGRTFYLRSYLNSKNSQAWKKAKDDSKHKQDYKGKDIINVPAVFQDDEEHGLKKNTKRIGQADVHTAEFVRQLHDEIIAKAHTMVATA